MSSVTDFLRERTIVLETLVLTETGTEPRGVTVVNDKDHYEWLWRHDRSSSVEHYLRERHLTPSRPKFTFFTQNDDVRREFCNVYTNFITLGKRYEFGHKCLVIFKMEGFINEPSELWGFYNNNKVFQILRSRMLHEKASKK